MQPMEFYILLSVMCLIILKQTNKDGLLQETFACKITNLSSHVALSKPLPLTVW